MQKSNRAAQAARTWVNRFPHNNNIGEQDSDDFETYSYEYSNQMQLRPKSDKKGHSPPRKVSGQAHYTPQRSPRSRKRSEDTALRHRFGTPKGEEYKAERTSYQPTPVEEAPFYENNYYRVTSRAALERNKAAVKIQAVYRGYRTRKEFWKLRERARRERDIEGVSYQTVEKEYVPRQRAEPPSVRMLESGQLVGTPSNADPHLGKLGHLNKIDPNQKENMLKQGRSYVDQSVPSTNDLQDETSSVVLLIGGLNPQEPETYHLLGSSIYVYNVEKNRWFFGGAMLEPRNYHAAVYCNGKVYVIGGFCPCTIRHGEMVATQTVFQLNIRGKRWRQRVDMHQCRAYHGVCVLNNGIIVVGGKDDEGRILSTVEMYDTLQDKWIFLKPLPKPIMAMAVTTLDDLVFVIGGLTNDSGKHELCTTVYVYDMRNPGWLIKSQLPEPLAFCSAVTVQREIWLWGGVQQKLSPDGYLTSSGLIYVKKNVSDSNWDVCKEQLSTPKHSMAITKTMGRKVFILGGMTSRTGEALIENDIFDLEAMKFLDGSPLPHAVTGCAAVGLPPDQSMKLLFKWAGNKVPEDVQDLAATKIQARFRGHMTRAMMEKNHGTPVYSSTLEALGGQSYDQQKYTRQSIKLTTSGRIDDDFRKFKTLTITEWPPSINPTSSKSEVNLAFGTHPPGYTVREKDHRSQVKRYITLRLDCDPNLGTVQNIEDFFKRTRQSVGLRRLEPTPYAHLEVKGDNAIRDDCIPVVLVIGGLNVKNPTNYAYGRSVLKYHPLKDRWQYIGVMPEPKNHHAAAYLEDAIYVTGGLDPDLRNSGEMVATRSVFAMNVSVAEWVRKASMISTRAFHSLVALQGKLYAIGGRDNNGRLIASIECYDPKTDKWTLMRPMVSPRMGMACVAYENRIWCIGGIGLSDNDSFDQHLNVVTTVSSFDPTTGSWTSRPPLRCPRAFACCLNVNKKMWLCAGCCRIKDQETLVSMASIDSYDVNEAIWERRTVISNPRHCAATAAVEDCIYLFGGVSSQEWSALTHNEMVISTDHSIHSCTDLAHPLTGAAAITIPPHSPSLRAASLSFLLHYKLIR